MFCTIVSFGIIAWKVGFPTRTSCTAGGVCPRHPLTHPHCDVKYLIEDILTYVKYAKSTNTLINSNDQKKKERGRGRSETKRLQFVVTGALNVKTVLADGMPTQFRRGAAWNDVMWFVGKLVGRMCLPIVCIGCQIMIILSITSTHIQWMNE